MAKGSPTWVRVISAEAPRADAVEPEGDDRLAGPLVEAGCGVGQAVALQHGLPLDRIGARRRCCRAACRTRRQRAAGRTAVKTRWKLSLAVLSGSCVFPWGPGRPAAAQGCDPRRDAGSSARRRQARRCAAERSRGSGRPPPTGGPISAASVGRSSMCRPAKPSRRGPRCGSVKADSDTVAMRPRRTRSASARRAVRRRERTRRRRAAYRGGNPCFAQRGCARDRQRVDLVALSAAESISSTR